MKSRLLSLVLIGSAMLIFFGIHLWEGQLYFRLNFRRPI